MIKNEEAKTSVKMRIIVLAIAIFMLGSTFALYAGLVLNYNNPATTSTSQKQKRFEELYTQYQEKLNAQAAELSNKYFSEFSQYRNRVKSFNAASVGVLTVTDLKVGTGRELTDISDIDYAAYYITHARNFAKTIRFLMYCGTEPPSPIPRKILFPAVLREDTLSGNPPFKAAFVSAPPQWGFARHGHG